MPDEAVPMLSDVNHAELFSSTQDEPIQSEPAPQLEPAPEPQPQAESNEAEPRADATGRLHGPDGKFIPKQAQPDAAPIQPQPVQEQQPSEPEAMVPSWRLRELREQREAAERRAQEYERELREFRSRQQQVQQPQVEIDPLTDPQGYAQAITTQFEQQRARDRLELKFEVARVRYGEKFDEAFQAFMQEAERNPHFGQAVVRSSDPGGTVWQWHQGQTILREVGPDPMAYRQKLRDELLNDQAFIAEAIKRVQAAQASNQPGARPTNLTQLPPSLSKATGATANTPETTPTGAELFQHALRG